MSSAGDQQILTTDFYGEKTVWSQIEAVFCEELRLRSARYDWQIKPHRHKDFMQVFFVLEGQGNAQADDTHLTLKAGDILTVPAGCIHTFLWEPDSNGFVLFITHPLLNQTEKLLGRLDWLHGGASQFKTEQDLDFIHSLFSRLNHEYQNRQPQRELMLENLVLSICININRLHLLYSHRGNRTKTSARLEKFINLVDEHYQQQHSVGWYADQIAITPAHLNSICRSQHRQSALGIIHARILTEAQRQLIYSGKSASAIAMALGFSDPAYFNRFFKRLTGSTPSAFRRLQTARE